MMQDDLRAILSRFRRALLLARVLESAARGAMVGGGLAAGGMILRAMDWPDVFVFSTLPAWAIPAAVLPLGAFLGVVVALRRGVSTLQAARLLDRRYERKEHLSTAAELLAKNDTSPEAMCVYAQARQAGRALPRRLDLWRCSRRTPAALGLILLLCGALLLLPTRDDRLAEALLADTAQGQAMTTTLRHHAEAGTHPETRRLLRDLADTIEVRDEAKLRRLLARLRKAGVSVRKLLAEESSEKLSLVSSPSPSLPIAGRPTPPDASASTTPSFSTKTHRANSTSAPSVSVYHPRYTDVAQAGPRSDRRVDPPHANTQSAWSAAKAHAAQAGRDQSIPVEYQSILRAFLGKKSTGTSE